LGFQIVLSKDTPTFRTWFAFRRGKSNLIWKEILTFGEKPNSHGMMLLKITHHIVKAYGCNINESQGHISSLPAATFFTVRKNIQRMWKRGISYRGEMSASDTGPTQTALCDFRLPPRCRYNLCSPGMLQGVNW
jgi:hypothetical protein